MEIVVKIESDAQDQFENKKKHQDEKYILSIYLIGHHIGPSVVYNCNYNYIDQKIRMLSHVKHHSLE